MIADSMQLDLEEGAVVVIYSEYRFPKRVTLLREIDYSRYPDMTPECVRDCVDINKMS